MSMTLLDAHNQWANRPADERFPTVKAAYDACLKYASTAVEKADVNPATLRVEPVDSDIQLVGKGNIPARLTHWAFGQLAARTGAPAAYLRKLPATLASQNLNHGLKATYGTVDAPRGDEKVNLLIHSNGSLLVRAFSSEKYSRIWNHELLAEILKLQEHGWHNPVPFNRGPEESATYESDHDMFCFQVFDRNLVSAGKDADGRERQLRRGFIMSNSEVGAAKWRTKMFLYDYMCCNHMIWGAEQVSEVSVRHVGNASERMQQAMQQFRVELKRYADGAASLEEAKIAKARTYIIAATKQEVIETVFKKLRGIASQVVIEAGYDTAQKSPDTDASPNSAWALANGMTRYSQTLPYADDRNAVDMAAGKVVEMAF